jgi:hypothetical protein
MIHHRLPEAVIHGTTLTIEGPCKVTGKELSKDIVLTKNELCSFSSVWYEHEKKNVWVPHCRCTRIDLK